MALWILTALAVWCTLSILFAMGWMLLLRRFNWEDECRS